jgi:DNA segregation ATPase FtsK/SpoIIIE-like protein
VTREEAIEIMRSAGSRSIPYLQRHLRVSYDEAYKLFEEMDKAIKFEFENE